MKFALSFILIATTITGGVAFAQASEELEKRYGFKDIRLESVIDDYSDFEFVKEIEHDKFKGAKLYENKKGTFESIGSVAVNTVELKTYKDKIFEIRVETEMDPKLYQGITKALGEDGKWSARNKSYYWSSENLNLQFKKISRRKLQLLYYSTAMERSLKEEKKEAVEEISDDF